MHPQALDVFRDSYVVDFLALPDGHSEADLHKGLLDKLKHFLLELGRDFCFIGSEYPVQVGKQDFALDLLFFHRGLNALVAIELKVERFAPAHLGQLDFYLEALDCDHRKEHENPAIGVDDAILDSSEAHCNQMMQLLSDPRKAAGFAKIVFDLLTAGRYGQ